MGRKAWVDSESEPLPFDEIITGASPIAGAVKVTTMAIRPGILVSLKTTCQGGAVYEREELGKERLDGGGEQVAWQTRRIIENPAEHEAAKKTRSKARALIARVCVTTNFGLLCPTEREPELDASMAEGRRMVSEHNKGSSIKLGIYVIKGRVAGTDEEAARSILSEVSGLVEEMNSGIDKLDVEAIREAADRAKRMSAMLEVEQAVKVGEAVAQARSAARLITKRAGEDPKLVLLDIQRGSIERARIAFLDLSDDAVVPGEQLPQVSAQRFANLDVEEEVADAV
jgi:hypothetical protein